jgi:hypothetical protein
MNMDHACLTGEANLKFGVAYLPGEAIFHFFTSSSSTHRWVFPF